MQFTIPHTLSAAEAVARVQKAIASSRREIEANATDIEERWEGSTLHFGATLQGKRITGTLEVRDKEFEIQAKLPLLWRMFEGQIEKAIKAHVAALQR